MSSVDKFGPQIAVTGLRPRQNCDGNEGRISHTEADCRNGAAYSSNPDKNYFLFNWWRVDLEEPYAITRVVV